ncbi:MAG: S49 family peptidase [Ignavibacteria bacterium]|nr:S49 family peptidase [Ignavibacteria bacterium]
MWQKVSNILKSSFSVISIIVVLIIWSTVSYFGISFGKEFFSNADTSITEESSENEDCNVYGINLHGDIVTYHSNDAYNDQDKLILDQTSADEVEWAIDKAENTDTVKAILIEIDSSGGYGEAGEEMMRVFKESQKPVVAFIRGQGLSAAYLAATGAETIFASKFSDVGSIGITMSYLQNTEKNKKDGLTYIDLSSGIYKDSGSPNRPITDAEKQIFMRDVKIAHEYFVNLVAQNRNLDIEKVKALADGSSVMGEQALKDGLIDKIGLFPDVKNFLTEKIGAPVTVCWQN